MMNIKLLTRLVALILLMGACDKDLAVDTSPIADYHLFFDYLAYDYSYKDNHSQTIEQYRQKYLSQIRENPTQEKLAEIFLNMTDNELKDPHVYFKTELSSYATVTVKDPVDLDQVFPSFSEVKVVKTTDFYTYGTIASNSDIGYLYIKDYNSDIGGTSSLGIEDGVYDINDIIAHFNRINVTSIIIDIRSTAGGSHYIPRYIAQRFADKKAVYMREEYPVGNTFKTKEWSIDPRGEHGFREGKIALLTNGNTCSGGEMFVLAMLVRDNITHIGSRTEGCSGNIADKDLANGWQLRITNSRTEMPDGTQYFKVGITPEIIVKYDVSRGEDAVLKRAIEVLQ